MWPVCGNSSNSVVGPPAALVQRLGELAEAGATRVHLRVIDMADLDHLDLIADQVLPQLR